MDHLAIIAVVCVYLTDIHVANDSAGSNTNLIASQQTWQGRNGSDSQELEASRSQGLQMAEQRAEWVKIASKNKWFVYDKPENMVSGLFQPMTSNQLN